MWITLLGLKELEKRKKLLGIVHNNCMIDSRLMTLRTFAACGTVAATAELTGYSPSAISAQLRELQRALGVQLLVKEGRGIRLTAAGRYLVTGSDELIADWERLKASIVNAGGQKRASLGLGGFSTAAAHLLAPLAAKLRATNDELAVQLIEASPDRCYELLIAERIDLAVVVAMQSEQYGDTDPRFEHTFLLDDPLDVVIPADHPLAEATSVRLEELAGESWITDTPGSTYRALFTAAFTAAGVTPKVVHESLEWETMTAFVGAGLGVGLLPRLATMGGNENIRRLRLTGPARPTRRIVAVVRRGGFHADLIEQSVGILQEMSRRILGQRLEEER